MNRVKLYEIAEVLSGLSYRRYLTDDGEEYEVIVQRSIKKDGILDDFEKLKLKTENIKPHHLTKTNDVLMKMPYPYDVCCVSREGLVISDRIAIIRLKQGYDPSFIAHLLTNAHIKKQLYEFASTEKIPHAALKQIKELELVVPFDQGPGHIRCVEQPVVREKIHRTNVKRDACTHRALLCFHEHSHSAPDASICFRSYRSPDSARFDTASGQSGEHTSQWPQASSTASSARFTFSDCIMSFTSSKYSPCIITDKTKKVNHTKNRRTLFPRATVHFFTGAVDGT